MTIDKGTDHSTTFIFDVPEKMREWVLKFNILLIIKERLY